MRTSAKRKLIPESDIIQVKQRVELGVPLNTAVRMLIPGLSNVAAIKLVNWHTEMEQALEEDDFFQYDIIKSSLFPPWLPNPQPDDVTYVGHFPYGYWENKQQ